VAIVENFFITSGPVYRFSKAFISGYPPLRNRGPITKGNTTMSKSIGNNIKTIAKQSVNLPLELTGASVELLADATSLGSAFITEVVPTAKDVGRATGTFLLGVFNSELTEEELNTKASTLSFASIREAMVAGAGKAGQNLVKAWNEDEVETTSNTDKQDL